MPAGKKARKKRSTKELVKDVEEKTKEILADEKDADKSKVHNTKKKVMLAEVEKAGNPEECGECPSTFGKHGCRPCVIWKAFEKNK